jgi:hypothetical protein
MSTETNHARDNAQAWSQTIADMVAALEATENGEQAEAAQEAIQEAPLSAQVRSDWYRPGEQPEAVEYQILLSYGGPSLRITGQLGKYGEADSAHLEYQDWGTPWTRYHPPLHSELFDSHNENVLTFAQQFYFGD